MKLIWLQRMRNNGQAFKPRSHEIKVILPFCFFPAFLCSSFIFLLVRKS
jgi:hypothetical protein